MITSLDDFYAATAELREELVRSGEHAFVQRVEDAELGGATSGEVLERLSLVLTELERTDIPDRLRIRQRVSELTAYIARILGPASR